MQFNAKQLQSVFDDNVKNYGANKLIEMTFNSLMKFEREAFLLENGSSQNKGNGYRKRSFAVFNGNIKFKIPRDRLSQFNPYILEILKNQEQETRDLAFNLYSKGLSTRDIEDILSKVYGDSYKKSTISYITQKHKEVLEEWRNRPLEKFYPIIMIDALHAKVRRDASVENEAFYVIFGVRKDKSRDILAMENIPTESASGWLDLLMSLKDRGVKDTKLVIADGLPGLENSIAKAFKSAKFQKCVTHFKREILKKVRNSDKGEISKDLREVFRINQEDYTKEKALENLCLFADKWGSKYSKNQELKE